MACLRCSFGRGLLKYWKLRSALMDTFGLFPLRCNAVRRLHLYEHQNKALLKRHGVNVEKFIVVGSLEQAEEGIKHLPKDGEYVVKAQVLAGGRMNGRFSNGFRGGVKLATKPAEVFDYVKQMLGHKLITEQTGEEGMHVAEVMIAEKMNYTNEAYLAIVLDRASSCPMFMLSSSGGTDIEKSTQLNPEIMFMQRIDLENGLSMEMALCLAGRLKFFEENLDQTSEQLQRLYDAFLKMDATQIEINPLIHAIDGKVYCVDAKMHFDDSAAFRQKDIFRLKDDDRVDPIEREARKQGLNYVNLDGDIGCMVNGAGLAMATMDIIKLYGGEPANFLDLRGAVTESSVCEATKLLLADSKVKCVYINIFGGIVNCEMIARGLLKAILSTNFNLPLVVRLCGTNDDIAYRLLEESGVRFHHVKNLADGAEKAVECAANV